MLTYSNLVHSFNKIVLEKRGQEGGSSLVLWETTDIL